MILYEYDETGACVGSFDADPRDIEGSWMDHTNREIERMVNRITAECRKDYLSRKDPDYVNYDAPCMCYVECEFHGEQIGSRDYPHKGTSPKGLCAECTADLGYALRNGIITVVQLDTLPPEQVTEILRIKVYGKRIKPSCPTFGSKK